MSGIMAGKEAVPYVSLLFSERERNHYLYLPDVNGVIDMASELPIPTNAPIMSSKLEAQRQSLAWWNHLLPFYGAFASLFNSMPDAMGISYKFPIQIINDNQLDAGDLLGAKALVVPVPHQNLQVPQIGLQEATISSLQTVEKPLIPVFQNENWFSELAIDAVREALQRETRDAVIDNIGLPDVYITGHTKNAHSVFAGFYTNKNHTQLAIPLVANPSFAIPRYKPLKDAPYREAADILDLETLPDDAFDSAPIQVEANSLQVHIRKGNTMKFSAPSSGSYTIMAYRSDMTGIALNIIDAGDEYIIQIPSFSCTMMVQIDIAQ